MRRVPRRRSPAIAKSADRGRLRCVAGPQRQPGLSRQLLGKGVRLIAIVELIEEIDQVAVVVDGVNVPDVGRIAHVDLQGNGLGADLSHRRDREAASMTLRKTPRYPTSNAN